MEKGEARKAKLSVPSLIAIVAALLSFTTGAFWGFVLAVVAIVSGLIGVALSLSPTVRGGLISAFSLIAGLIGLIAAVIKALLWLL
jgi:hypothetical protein